MTEQRAGAGGGRAERARQRWDDDTLREEPDGEPWDVREDHLVSRTHEELDRIPGHDAFWFGWYAFYPTTEIYEKQERP